MTAAVPKISYCCSLPCIHARACVQFRHSVSVRGLHSPSFKFRSEKKRPSSSLTTEPDAAPTTANPTAGDKGRVSGIQVPRQKHISVSKSELLNALVLMFKSRQEVDQFLLVSSCLDSILHAEHRSILEEMRMDYDLIHCTKDKGSSHDFVSKIPLVPNTKEYCSEIDSAVVSPDIHGADKTELDVLILSYLAPDLTHLFRFSPENATTLPDEPRIAVASRFQRAFVRLLHSAQFEELSARDLMLTSALNTDYLLTLPIYVDWKRASQSNAIIFRRGYATEKQKGLLIVEKLDYLQSRLLQAIFHIFSKPLVKVGIWLEKMLGSIILQEDVQSWIENVRPWFKDISLFQQSYYDDEVANDSFGVDDDLGDDLPIWLAAQKAVTRYEGILSPVGPRGRLFRKFLSLIGFVPPTTKNSLDLNSDISTSKTCSRPIFLSRISLNDIWERASRKYSGDNLWKKFKNIVSILLTQSILQEPAFQELILLYTKEIDGKTKDQTEVLPLQLKIFERIPIPDLPVIFPHKKLSFRILDTVRLDIATILGLLAFFINYKFEDILSSPSAIFLDVISVTALIIYVTRVALGYKQTWDRYQLLVNRTLFEKTIASGFGSVHFLLDASEQQQYKEAILAYAILLKSENGQVTSAQTIGEKCERFLYDLFDEKVEMPVDKAINTLKRLNLAIQMAVNGDSALQAVPCSKAYETLKDRWNKLLRE